MLLELFIDYCMATSSVVDFSKVSVTSVKYMLVSSFCIFACLLSSKYQVRGRLLAFVTDSIDENQQQDSQFGQKFCFLISSEEFFPDHHIFPFL